MSEDVAVALIVLHNTSSHALFVPSYLCPGARYSNL